MKRKVTIEFEVDPTQYYKMEDSEEGVTELVRSILMCDADFPPNESINITCGKANDIFRVDDNDFGSFDDSILPIEK